MTYIITTREIPTQSGIIVVGCGGTGGFVAEGLCRLLTDKDRTLLLIDHDRVEQRNLRRQNFYQGEVGKFKSQALAERLSRLYGRQIAYCVYPYNPHLFSEVLGGGVYRRAVEGIIIGCVDNAEARKAIGEGLPSWSWWIDAGNGHHSGQVLIGNERNQENLHGAFRQANNTVSRLPIPTLQLPSLLAPPVEPPREERSCAEAVEAEEQSPLINQAMATLVLEFVSRLLQGKLTWMGAYLDLAAGTLQTVPAEPEIVARMTGVRVDTLVSEVCPHCGKRHE